MSQSYKNLKILGDAMSLAVEIYSLSKKFPKDEIFGITSQLRRAVVSISSNIAEGSSRSSKKDYARFIDISIGSLHETENLLELSYKLEYLTKNDYDKIVERISSLGILLGGFRKYINSIFSTLYLLLSTPHL